MIELKALLSDDYVDLLLSLKKNTSTRKLIDFVPRVECD